MVHHPTGPAGASPGAAGSFGERLARAGLEVDALLERSARHYPTSLPVSHPERFLDRPEPLPEICDLPAWSDRTDPGTGIEPAVRRARAVGQDQARAMLVGERLGDVFISAAERERLIARAVGILPAADEELFRELLLVPEITPGRFAQLPPGPPGGARKGSSAGVPRALLTAVEAISRCFRPATGLAWGMFILAGNRAPEQMRECAAGLDRLCLRVTSAPPVLSALDRAAAGCDRRRKSGDEDPEACFRERFGVLVAVRDRLWALKPGRVSTPFLLPQVLDYYLGDEEGVGNSLGLGLIDAIILGKLGFEVSLMLVGDTVQLEVEIAGRGIAWETVRPSPPSFVAVGNARRLSPAELFALSWSSLAAVHFAQGRVDRAVRQYENVVAVLPESAEAWCGLGNCHLRRSAPESARDCFKRALELAPENAEAHHGLGNTRAMLEQWPRAIEAYKRALCLRPDCVEVYNNLGFAFQHAGEAEQAIAAWRAALDIQPGYAQAHFNLGNIALELERYDDAIRHYRDALRHRPGFAQAWYNMGQAHYGKRQLDQAQNCYRRAIEANPRHFGAWHNLGIVYRDKGQRDKAVEALERAVSLNPNLMR